jgi:hypothetical protein
MQRTSLMWRACVLLLTLAAPGVFFEAFAQDRGAAPGDEVETLRNRVRNLELQNAKILEQLSQIQELLASTAFVETSRTQDVLVVSTGPVPASSVSRALEVSPASNRSLPQPPLQSEAPIVRARVTTARSVFTDSFESMLFSTTPVRALSRHRRSSAPNLSTRTVRATSQFIHGSAVSA